MPLPKGDDAPLACVPPDHPDHGPCCFDCAAADTLVKAGMILRRPLDLRDLDQAFLMARIAVGNDRQEQLRLPGIPMGLVFTGLVRPCSEGDLQKHHDWMDRNMIPWRFGDDE